MSFVFGAFLVTALVSTYGAYFVHGSPLPWWDVGIIVVFEALIFFGLGYFAFGASEVYG